MSGKPVATVGSMHACPMVTGTTPHVGGPIIQGEANILVNGKPIATMGSMCTCVGPPDTVAQGNPTVLANGKPVACLGDLTAHGGVITSGEANVIIGSGASEPTTVMPVKKIPFPEFNFPNRVLANTIGQGKNLKKAEENQDKLRNMKEEGEPKIYNLKWKKERKIIRGTKVLKQVTLEAYVSNIDEGKTVTLKVKKPLTETDANGNSTNSEENIIELSGTVQDKKVMLTWEVEDNTIEDNTKENKNS